MSILSVPLTSLRMGCLVSDVNGSHRQSTHDQLVRRFEFFGCLVDVAVQQADVSDLEFFYGAFQTSTDRRPDLRVSLGCPDWPERGFFASLLAKDELAKSVRILRQDGSQAENRFTTWSDLPSPLPPFDQPPLADRVRTYPGACVRLRSGRLIVLLGKNYVGKTSTAIALCRRGARLVSDSVLVADRSSGSLLPYETPLGFRSQSLRSLIDEKLRRGLDHRLTVSPDTGLVALVRPRDLFGAGNDLGGRVDSVVLLYRGERFGVGTDATPAVPWHPFADFGCSPPLPSKCTTLSRPDGLSAEAVADAIEEVVR